MPLYDVSYQRFEGGRRNRLSRSWALGRTQLFSLLRQRRFLLLMAVSWIPAIIRGGQIYVARQFPEAMRFFEVTPSLWREFLSQQVSLLLVILVALYAGSGTIASDLRSGAILVYLSKPISRMGYILGKGLPVFLALLGITLVPGLTLLLLQVLMADDLSLLREAPWLPGSILAYSIWMSAYFSLIVLAVSSLSRSTRLAAAGFVLLALGSHFLYGMATRITAGDAPPYLSVLGAAVDVSNLFFGEMSTRSVSALGSFAMMALLMVGSVLVINYRLQSTEVTS
jgi:ABC-type transport system involved in multi-copper enzyme maturation permease subunit